MAHLYFMSRSDAPGALKVGRSDDPVRRALDLQAGHFFTMKVLARVEGAGGFERSVHALLQDSRIEGPGVEWFRCSLAKALAATARVMDDAAPCEENDPMDDEEVSLEGTCLQERLLAWIAERCEPVQRRDATKVVEFKQAAARHLGITPLEVGGVMAALGMTSGGVPNSMRDRVACGAHPGWTTASVPGLRLRERAGRHSPRRE